jgi:hypothetical protein
MIPTQKAAHNPLANFMRQPKIYIKIPSGGEFWPTGSIDIPENGEFPVYSMTAKDELMLKVPDALMNGQAVVEVIQHCMPNIKNAWFVPNLDLDVILIAIRIATYGEIMTLPVNLGEDKEFEYQLNLNILLDQLQSKIVWETAVPISSELTIHVKPINYKVMTESALKTFETQKLLETASSAMAEEDKLKTFNESFQKLNDITIGIVNQSVYAIETSDGATDNAKHIKEFMENADKDIFDAVRNHIDELRKHNSLGPMTIEVTPEMKEQGIEAEKIEVPLVFDPTVFFA